MRHLNLLMICRSIYGFFTAHHSKHWEIKGIKKRFRWCSPDRACLKSQFDTRPLSIQEKYNTFHEFIVMWSISLFSSSASASFWLSWPSYERMVALPSVRNVLEHGNVMFFNTLKELAHLWLWTLCEERCLSGEPQVLSSKCG